MLQKLITQLLLLLTIASLFGLTLNQFGVHLYYGIPLGIVIQFIFFYVFTTSLNAFIALKNKKLENDRIKEFSLQGLEVTCPCPLRKTEFVPITLNTNNTYKCNQCSKNVSVYIVPETAIITETIANTDILTAPALKNL
jgi:hypothetical protein